MFNNKPDKKCFFWYLDFLLERRRLKCLLFFILETYYYISPLVCAFFLALTPIWVIIAAKHPATRTVLHSGWEPVITAMVISRWVLAVRGGSVSSEASFRGIATMLQNGVSVTQSNIVTFLLQWKDVQSALDEESRGERVGASCKMWDTKNLVRALDLDNTEIRIQTLMRR